MAGDRSQKCIITIDFDQLPEFASFRLQLLLLVPEMKQYVYSVEKKKALA